MYIKYLEKRYDIVRAMHLKIQILSESMVLGARPEYADMFTTAARTGKLTVDQHTGECGTNTEFRDFLLSVNPIAIKGYK